MLSKKARELLLKRLQDFVKEKSKVLILFHSDADGLCSALLTFHVLKKFCKKIIAEPLTQEKRGLNLKKIKKFKAERIIILDWNIDQSAKDVKELEKEYKILIIDHHKIYADLNSENTIFIKSQYFSTLDGSKYPTAKLCYDLFSNFVDIEKYSWLALVGLKGDNAISHWKNFVEVVMKKFKISKKWLEEFEELISSVEAYNKKLMKKLFEVLKKEERPQKNLKKIKFYKLKEKMEKEIKKFIKEFSKRAEIYEKLNLIFYKIKSKFYIKSIISNKLSKKFPNKTIILILDKGKKELFISARRQDYKVAVNDLLELATKDLKNANAGGHIPAAGGKILRKDLKKFKQNIIRILEEGK